ncbi:MAG: hypothetical protein HFI72_03350 [Peptococcaceae bacterium]|jgi:type I restriction enzyme S subunit|nr:hypothetical protein [Peptococcaceae bacterium]
MKPYKEYKDSGVPWIGKIPKDWGVKKLKYIFKINMGQSPDVDKCNNEKMGIPFLQGKKDFGIISPIATTYCTEPKKNSFSK